MPPEETSQDPPNPPAYLRFGRRKMPMPKTKFMRTVLGASIIVWGIIPVPPGLAIVPVGMTVRGIVVDHRDRLSLGVELSRRRGVPTSLVPRERAQRPQHG